VISSDQLDPYLCSDVRREIEQRYYARVNAAAQLEQLIHDPEFLRDLHHDAALWPDHGIVHVRDVAHQVLRVLDVVHGILVPARDPQRFHFMQAYGVLAAYVHDIGMFDFSPFGRAMHPEVAAQAVMGAEFDDLVTAIQAENCGGIAERIAGLAQRGAFQEPPGAILRQMMAMAMCHSKSKVPVELLNAPGKLYQRMQCTLASDLQELYHQQQVKQRQLSVPGDRTGASFSWLVSGDPAARQLAGDVIDTLRALRAADSLRQRGTVLKTSGNYEIMVDRITASAIWALRLGQEQLFLLQSDDPVAAGEANIASSTLESSGSLRIVFHRGAFLEPGAVRRAARNAAYVVNDVQRDVIESFLRPRPLHGLLNSDDVPILLEGTDDNLEFAGLVHQELLRLNPELPNPVRCVPSLHNATALEVTRYLESRNLDWNMDKRRELIDRLAASGTKTQGMDLVQAFQDVRLIELAAGQVLIEANSPSVFVYIPLGDGLQVIPLGGYAPFPVRPWMPLGNTGVIRGAERNADIVAEEGVELLVIPQEVFLKYWHRPYTAEELRRIFAAQ
jgi:hypothetical protein